MASEFLYITGSSISEVQSLIAPYIALGYNVVGSITEVLGMYTQGIEKIENDPGTVNDYMGVLASSEVLGMYTQGIEKIENDPGTVNDYMGVLASYNYSDGINRGNNIEMLSKNFRQQYGTIGNPTSSLLTSAELTAYNGE